MAGNTKRKNKRGLAFVSIFLLLILAAAGGVSSDKNKDNTTGTTEAVATSEITTEAFAGNDRDVAGRPADTLSGKDDNSDISGDGSGSDVVAPTTESDRPAFVAVPADDSEAYAIINDNMPGFSDEDKKSTEPFEEYSELDELGRCGVAYADICKELMPEEERGEIGQIKPSGWHTVKYNGIVDGNYLYNRCHLIAYQLAGENANEKNLITGTRYLNVQGMVPFEDQVAQYVKDTGNHVLYRVTPYFEGDNLVANGVQIEAWSVEDEGSGICFNVFCYNVQPGIDIDYATGDSEISPDYTGEVDNSGDNSGSDSGDASGSPRENADGRTSENTEAITENNSGNEQEYILNTNTKKIHRPSCSSVKHMKESNKRSYTGSLDDLLNQGYEPCKKCM